MATPEPEARWSGERRLRAALARAELDADAASEMADLRRRVEELHQAVRARDDFIAIAAHELRNPMTPILGMAEAALAAARNAEGACLRASRPCWSCSAPPGTSSGGRPGCWTSADRVPATCGWNRPRPTSPNSCARSPSATPSRPPRAQRARARGRGRRHRGVGPARGRGDRREPALQRPQVRHGQAGDPPAALGRALGAAGGAGPRGRHAARPAEAHLRRFEQVVGQHRGGGFGVGLWVASRLVAAMEGQIAVSSRPGEGSTFAVTLPLAPRNRIGRRMAQDEADTGRGGDWTGPEPRTGPRRGPVRRLPARRPLHGPRTARHGQDHPGQPDHLSPGGGGEPRPLHHRPRARTTAACWRTCARCGSSIRPSSPTG